MLHIRKHSNTFRRKLITVKAGMSHERFKISAAWPYVENGAKLTEYEQMFYSTRISSIDFAVSKHCLHFLKILFFFSDFFIYEKQRSHSGFNKSSNASFSTAPGWGCYRIIPDFGARCFKVLLIFVQSTRCIKRFWVSCAQNCRRLIIFDVSADPKYNHRSSNIPVHQ